MRRPDGVKSSKETFFFFSLLIRAFAERRKPVKGARNVRGEANPLLAFCALLYWASKGKNTFFRPQLTFLPELRRIASPFHSHYEWTTDCGPVHIGVLGGRCDLDGGFFRVRSSWL